MNTRFLIDCLFYSMTAIMLVLTIYFIYKVIKIKKSDEG